MSISESFNNIKNTFYNESITTITIESVLLFVTILAIYEFIVYKFVSHRNFYNKSFNITVAILPFFISTIILCLQSNLVITLGTIGALAIIRFRTVVKNPTDMVYILWSVHTGIVCGCQLYEVAVLTSVFVTIILLILENINIGKMPYILVVNLSSEEEKDFNLLLKTFSKRFRIKSRNFSNNKIDYVVEISIKNVDEFIKKLNKTKYISKYSIIEYDAEDIL